MQELVLVRHGETVGQSSIRLYGATDVALAPLGGDQVRAGTAALRGHSFDRVFTSPLSRARRSAQVALETIGAPHTKVELVDGFREINFGDWEGLTWEEVERTDPQARARLRAQGADFVFPGGDRRRDFAARVQSAIDPSIGQAFARGARRVLVVVHKGVIKRIMAHLLARPFTELDTVEIELGSVHRLERRPPHAWSVG